VPGVGKSRRRREQQTRSFGTAIGQLETLADWLQDCGVTLIGMEATGVYWKPVFYVLELRFDCWLLNAQHLQKRSWPQERRDRLGRYSPGLATRPSSPFWPRQGCGPRSRRCGEPTAGSAKH
jgi:hypothetical protein